MCANLQCAQNKAGALYGTHTIIGGWLQLDPAACSVNGEEA
jgi:hypothetical protein